MPGGSRIIALDGILFCLIDLSQMKTQARFRRKLMDKVAVTMGEAMVG